MHKPLFSLMLAVALIVGCGRGADVASTDPTPDSPAESAVTQAASFYTVNDYDPERDADADLSATIVQAKADNKRIILEIGGHW